jgi:putative glutamine amidotransferase
VALLEAVRAAGGEPVTVLPAAPDGAFDADHLRRRLSFADAVLLPGGGDVSPAHYGARQSHGEVYDVDEVQDAFDLAVARWAVSEGVPLLAVCRGLQVVNVAHGGSLEQHMEVPHRHVRHEVVVSGSARLAELMGTSASVSCYHHQRIETLGAGLQAVATCADGGVEAVECSGRGGYFLGVQWHPEDTASEDSRQAALFGSLVDAAR